MKYFVLILTFLGFLWFFMFDTSTAYSQTDSFDEMNYSQFLDFCHRYNPALWDSIPIEERLLSNLCDFVGKGFGEKQWNWLNGAKLDWESFAKNASEGYADKIPEFTDGGIKETLHVDSFVSVRDSFPPPMMAMISFDYEKLSQVIRYDEKFTICIDGKLVPQDSFIECSDEYVKYDFTKEEPFSIPKFAKKIPLPEHTRQQMSDWCQNSPKWAKIDKQFWDVIPVRLVSNTGEFQSLQGIKDSFVISSNAMHDTCPPIVWASGTFASEDGKSHRFALEYNADFFRYVIDEIHCKYGLTVVTKSFDGSFACVKPETKQKLIERGWAMPQLDVSISNDSSLLERYKNLPEVKAFYEKYDDTDVLVRADHLSYFAGNEDDFRVRMNLYFDENYDLKDIDFHCYVARQHKTEVAQEDILSYLKKYECK